MLKKLLYFVLLSVQFCIAQKPEFPTQTLKVGYFGNLVVNPGFVGSYEFTLVEGSVTKTRIKRDRQINKYKFNRLTFAPTLGFYADPGSHTSAFANISLLYRRINRKGRTLAIGPGMGYVGTFMKNVYSFSSGDISEEGIGAFAYAAPSFRVEIGRFKTKKDHPRGWYAALSTNILLNYNATFVPTPAIEFGKLF